MLFRSDDDIDIFVGALYKTNTILIILFYYFITSAAATAHL